MNRFFLDARRGRATWTILVIVGIIGLAYILRHVLLLAALSLFFANLLFPLVRLTERRVVGHRLLAIMTDVPGRPRQRRRPDRVAASVDSHDRDDRGAGPRHSGINSVGAERPPGRFSTTVVARR